MKKKWVLLGAVIVVGAIVLCAVVTLFRPMSFGGLTSQPDPTGDYAAAVERIEALRAELPEAYITTSPSPAPTASTATT